MDINRTENIPKERFHTFKVWGKMLPYIKPYRKWVAAIAAAMLVEAFIAVMDTLIAGYVVDRFIAQRTHQGISVFVVLYAGMTVMRTLVQIVLGTLALRLEMYVGRDLKRDLFVHLQTLSFSYYNQTPVGTIVARALNDPARIAESIPWMMVDGVYCGVYIIGCLIAMMVINWKLGLMVLAVVPFIAAFTVYFEKRILKVNRKARKINAEVTRHYNEGISGAKTSKTLVIEDKNLDTFKEVSGRMCRTSIKAVMLDAIYIPVISFLTALAVSFVITGGGNMAMLGGISIGQLTIFVNFALRISDPVQGLAYQATRFVSTQANVERVTELLELEPEITDAPEVIEKYGTSLEPRKENWESINGDITFEDVTFMYPDGDENVLEHFNLQVPAGSTVAIVGETGAGKSTLVNLACRFFEPTGGRILIDGRDYKERSMLWLHTSIGYVLQTPHLFSGSVKDNIRYGRLDATDKEIEAAAKLVNAHDFIMRMEKGYDSDVGEGGGQLSTGEKQLISFARAVLADPRIFVLDEATASIDTKTEALIQEAISTLLEGRTSFLIAHRLSTIRKADMILVVRDGRIIQRGTHSELMEQGGYYADLYNKQFETETAESVFNG
ncbi:ABC transporter ATP-binding protein [Acutalibacter sp. 1XD8-36]|uniref:ABC transporter ATP-binding protein n=1 Tax=Acutalibacter sp. 1XD8-36 TaxID=2320852 RepID=UPI001412BD2F|nr:ABC transporter ATP-binding protein [Acutalibacter sp. 1XD8-36]NBJ88661.1 ABC transporter ATP-binding protein [Acutalibacter sp. 1XD8-36]